MDRQIIIQSLLTLHLTGLILMAGITIVDYIAFRTFWKLFDQDKERSLGILHATAKFSRWIGIGAALLVLTGVGMMAATNGVFGEQLWFRIKFGFVVVLILNGLLIGRTQGIKLRKSIDNGSVDATGQTGAIKTNLNRFHLAQFAIFFIIILLSVFKFN